MRIPHLTHPERSQFYPMVKAKLPATRLLAEGETVRCELQASGGYKGRMQLRIVNGAEFETDWESADASRFPARIKAAATALRDCGQRGSFWVTHENGELVIETE